MTDASTTPATQPSRAIVADGKGQFSVETVDVAAPEGDEVLVRIAAAGLCHTDWDSITNWDGPFIVGHEGAGTVEAVGPAVRGLAAGDRVVLNWAIPCGDCHNCHAGLYSLCEVNSPAVGDGVSGHARPGATLYRGAPIRRSFNLGTMSELTVVKAAACTPIGDDIPFPVAAIMGCGVMTGFGSVVNAAKVAPGSSVAVIGCGGIGLNVIQASVISGATRIIAIDVTQDRLDQARRFGATDIILSDPADVSMAAVREQVRAMTVRGADYAFECTAIPALGAAPLALIRHGGTAVQVSGIEQVIPFDCTLFEWDKIYINPLYGKCDPPRDFPILQSLYRKGALKLDEMITQTYTFDQMAAAFADLLAGRLAKGVLLTSGGQ